MNSVYFETIEELSNSWTFDTDSEVSVESTSADAIKCEGIAY